MKCKTCLCEVTADQLNCPECGASLPLAEGTTRELVIEPMYPADPIGDRMNWSFRQRKLVDQFIQDLSALAIEDFTHQNGPRGISDPFVAFEQVKDDLESLTKAVNDRVRTRVMMHMTDVRRAAKG